jgi:hypothetical protein
MLAPAPARMPSRSVRPPLRLVGPDERVGPGELGCAPTLPATRLTRRGRLVITLVAAAAVVTVAVLPVTSVDAAAPEIDHATTVSAGQTLSEVAAAQLPRLPIPDAVARIQLANGLNTLEVHAGQSILIPAMP